MPPFVGVAVNVTFVPAQIVVPDAAILTDGATGAFTVIVIVLDVTSAGFGHAADDVITTVITLLFASVAF